MFFFLQRVFQKETLRCPATLSVILVADRVLSRWIPVTRYGTPGLNHNLRRLRAHAINNTLIRPTTLARAISRLGFVQADPIRSPATAQDLILRHRVTGYRAGDLERRYASLDIEEDILYAYGFLPRTNWQLLHPRDTKNLPRLERKVLDVVRTYGEMHPRQLEEHCGAERVVNAWGGYSKATTQALEDLHHRGLLRVARRERGIRIYAATPESTEFLSAEERGRKLVMLVTNIFAPAPEKHLQSLRFSKPSSCSTRTILSDLMRSGEIQRETVDGVAYLYPTAGTSELADEAPRMVRLLAPFDPLVWDRARFTMLWGWNYRFEAYTPVAKRIRGYYAMPLLWGDDVIGWANVSSDKGAMNVDVGFTGKRPRDAAFKSALEEEVERMRAFLKL